MTGRTFFSTKALKSLPESTRRGIRELEDNFQKMKHSTFSDELFVDQIEKSLRIFAQILDETTCAQGPSSLIVSQLDSIEGGIQFINSAITNRLESSRYLYGASLFSPQNMGPISRLYSFYELFVDLLERLIATYDKQNGPNGHQLDFLVDISAFTSVHAEEFVPLRCEEPPRSELIGITLNEQAFFQIRTTILILLHEIGHYVPPENREKRNRILQDRFLNWISTKVYHELYTFLHDEVLSIYDKMESGDERIAIGQVRTHFEKRLAIAIEPVITLALSHSLESFINSDQVISRFGKIDRYNTRLRDFQGLLELFLIDISNDLNRTLFSRKEAKPEHGIWQNMVGVLTQLVEVKDEEGDIDKKVTYIERICEIAIELFETNDHFQYKGGSAHPGPNRALESYLRSLSLLGVNEYSEVNVKLFTRVLSQCLKKSIDAVRDNQVLEMLTRGIDEAVAHLFCIRTLNIEDFDKYWKMMEPIMSGSYYGKADQIRFFGIPIAIITEYFRLKNGTNPLDSPSYKISPFNLPIPDFGKNKSKAEIDEMTSILQETFLVPVATYLTQHDDIFPENSLFQLVEGMPKTEDARLLQSIRRHFKEFSENTMTDYDLENELKIIDFLVNSFAIKKAL